MNANAGRFIKSDYCHDPVGSFVICHFLYEESSGAFLLLFLYQQRLREREALL
jgi:hypothetical protein